jgi:hypothetical protein
MEFIIGIAFHSEHCEKLCDPCGKETFSIERYILTMYRISVFQKETMICFFSLGFNLTLSILKPPGML